MKKWLLWGILATTVFAICWAISVVAAVASVGKLAFLANFFGYAALFALPVSIALVLVFRRGK